MENIIFLLISCVIMNSVPIVLSDGDTTEDAKGERNANAEMIAVTAHFFPKLQFLGFRLSSSLSQVTKLGSSTALGSFGEVGGSRSYWEYEDSKE